MREYEAFLVDIESMGYNSLQRVTVAELGHIDPALQTHQMLAQENNKLAIGNVLRR